MLKIRLRRTGAKKQPRYRVVVAESRAPRDGAFVEVLGWYNPQADPAQVVIDTAKADEWIKRGAQPSDRVAYLLKHTSQDVGTAAEAEAPVEAPAEAPADKPRRGRKKADEAVAEAAAPAAAEPTAVATDAGAAAEPITAPEPGDAAEVAASEAPESEGSAGSAGA